MDVSALIRLDWHPLTSDGKAFAVAGKRLSEARAHDRALCSAQVMEADTDKARVWSAGRQPPRHPTGLVVDAHREVPSPGCRVLIACAVAEQRFGDQLDR